VSSSCLAAWVVLTDLPHSGMCVASVHLCVDLSNVKTVVLVLSIRVGQSLLANRPRKPVLRRTHSTDTSLLRPVRSRRSSPLAVLSIYTDTMIDWGFVIGAFVPLVAYWMHVEPSLE
jgi:hypothetical protein